MERPNILFVFTDQQRSTALGCCGAEDVRTPNLDRFASQGTRFVNAISNTPVCSPARGTILTGRHVLGHGLVTNDIPMRTDIPHVAQALNQAGYRCGYIGKWHVDEADRAIFIPPGPRRRGFDDFWAVANCTHDYNGAHYYLNEDPAPYWHPGYEPFSQTDIAIEYLESRGPGSSDRPFCLFLSYGPPHCPYSSAPAEFHAMYADRMFRLLPNTDPDAPVETRGLKWQQFPGDAKARDLIAGYYAHVSALDHAFGRLTAALDRLGLTENTLVMFTSDHGDMLFSHNRGWKCKPWRESVGVPLLIRWPGEVPAGRVSGAPVGLVDMTPTILGAAGVPVPPGVEGCDLGALLRGDESAAPEEQYINFPCMPGNFSLDEWRGVVTRRHTFVCTREGPWMLFDDSVDPFQLTNLVDDPAQASVRDDLDARTRRWLQRTGDRFETSLEIADRYAPHHRNCVAPYFANETVKAGSRDPALRRYRKKGQGL
jgi:arylsulfatase A-like enzyme